MDRIEVDALEDCNVDSESSSDSELDDLILRMHRKEVVHEIKRHLKKSYDFHTSKRARIYKKNEVSFSRFSCKYFSDVIAALSEHQKNVIRSYDFGSLLLFDSSYVLIKFATWIAKHVDYKSSEIILSNKVISVSKDSVSTIFGLPQGGLQFSRDFESGKKFILSKYGLSDLPSVRFFACFLCPNSSLTPSTKYLTVFEDIENLRNYDWSKFIYDWTMTFLKKFFKSNNLGGCLFYWAALYLDHVDFGKKNPGNSTPRIAVWTKNMIQTYSDLDKVDDDNFGLRPLRDFKSVCYYQPHPTAERRISFKEKLDSALGSVLPLSMKEKLCSLMEHHCSEVHAAGSHTCEDVLIDALVLVAEDSVTPSDKVQNDVDDTNTEGCNAVPSRFDDNADVDASIPDDVVVCTPIENDPCVNSFVANGDDVIASGHAAALISSSNRDFDYELLTPKSAFVKKFKYCADHNLAGSASATIAASIHNVAKKFKTRFPELLNQNARDNIIDFSRPSFKLLDSEDDVSSSNDDANNQLNEEDNQAHGDITPPSSLLCKSFRSVPDSIDVIDHNNIRSNENSAGINQISSIFSNRVFQDVTNSPDVVFLGENKFPQTVKESCVKTEEIYNATNNLSRYTHGMSSSGGKLPAHGPRRIIVPSRHASDPFVPAMKRRFLVSDQENRYYIALCRLADSSKWQSYDAVDIDNVRAKFSSFGHSLKKTGVVLPFVMSVFCRFLFQNNHPSKSKKHYFFPSIGLFFPILHGQHWFVLVVDIKDRMLVFLDSLHQPDDEFFEPILPLLVIFDSGIFSMKFMEIWSPRIILSNQFTGQNINNIRVQYANQMFFHPNNKMLQTEVENVGVNWFDSARFPSNHRAIDA
uniref:Ubiquitin-like protease family profile domain-containing protein n=1 Tax=Oryza sativa subsp. japonica TaxID=39947 RepID=Q6YVN2_ORYSJ|nr:hypothetical protein [Oryza sativa Japonica Group]BAC92597.1 hypothetical protein [Oryza sativa Japonica Group]